MLRKFLVILSAIIVLYIVQTRMRLGGLLQTLLPSVSAQVAPTVTIINNPALAYSTGVVIDTQKFSFNVLTAQLVYSSATTATQTFGDGQVSTDSIVINNYAALSSATAIDNVQVLSTNTLAGVTLFIGNHSFTFGLDWGADIAGTDTGTATNLETAINALDPDVIASVQGSSIILTAASYGQRYNSVAVSSTPIGDSLLISSATLYGGQDNAVLNINGHLLTQGVQFSAAVSSAATTNSITSAIEANSILNAEIRVSSSMPAGAPLIILTSKVAGSAQNFQITSSTQTALTIMHPTMIGGVDPAFTLGSSAISIASNNLTLALPVLLSTGSASFIPGGLVNQTTYYAIPNGLNDIELATTSAMALADEPLIIMSSTVPTAQDVYTLTPLATVAPAGFYWTVSNDGVTFTPLSISSVTVNSFNGSQIDTWNFGSLGFRFLKLKIVAAAVGGLNIQSTVYGH